MSKLNHNSIQKSSKVADSLHSFTSNAHGRENNLQDTQGSFGVHNSTGAFVFSSLPIGFIPSTKTQTKDFNQVLIRSKLRALDSFSLPEKRRFLLSHSEDRKKFLLNNVPRSQRTVGFKIKTYSSGEVSGSLFFTGRESRFNPPPRYGSLQSTELTKAARTKIRRCVECSPSFMKYFWTLTFAPECMKPWQVDRQCVVGHDGPAFIETVRHDYAKYKLKKFLDTARHKQKRLNRDLLYVWVAEIQTETTHNIHFHILLNQFLPVAWVTKVWAQASNSVHIAPPIKSPDHAASYMRKYMSKDKESLIKGFRYQASNGLIMGTNPKERNIIQMDYKEHEEENAESVRALLSSLRSLKTDIDARGGFVMDYGFSVQKPRSARKYKNRRTGEVETVPGIDPRLGTQIAEILGEKKKRSGKIPF